jgi:hypothetical protein
MTDSPTWSDVTRADVVRAIKEYDRLRGLHAWNDSSDMWALRGLRTGRRDHGLGFGERILTPQIPDNEPIQLARGFQVLTGSAPPAYTDASNVQAPSTHKGVVQTRRTALDSR